MFVNTAVERIAVRARLHAVRSGPTLHFFHARSNHIKERRVAIREAKGG